MEAVATRRSPLFLNEFRPPSPAGPTSPHQDFIFDNFTDYGSKLGIETGADSKRKEVDIIIVMLERPL